MPVAIAALIVCGGRSRRMGQAKAWLPFGAETLLERVVRLVRAAAAPVVVVAASDQPLPALPREVVIATDPVAHRGPLQGIASGLAALSDHVELVYATGTDVPFLQPGWITLMASLIDDCDIAMPLVDGFHHPLAAVYRRATVLPTARALLQADRLRPVWLMETLKTRVVRGDELRSVDPDLATLRNLNTPEDYRAALGEANLAPLASSRSDGGDWPSFPVEDP